MKATGLNEVEPQSSVSEKRADHFLPLLNSVGSPITILTVSTLTRTTWPTRRTMYSSSPAGSCGVQIPKGASECSRRRKSPVCGHDACRKPRSGGGEGAFPSPLSRLGVPGHARFRGLRPRLHSLAPPGPNSPSTIPVAGKGGNRKNSMMSSRAADHANSGTSNPSR